MRGLRNSASSRALALLLVVSLLASSASAEPSHGGFPYAWRHRGAFTPQTMWFGHYPTRWRQWPGQEYQELTPAQPAEEVPSAEDDASGAPKPPEDDTLPAPGGEQQPESEPSILPPLEVPGGAPAGPPTDFDPTSPFEQPSGADPIPPLLPQTTPGGATPPTGGNTLEPPATEPSAAPEAAPSGAPLESPPLESPPLESTPTAPPSSTDPIPPLETPGSTTPPLPEPSGTAPAPGSQADAEASLSGPRLGAALPGAKPMVYQEGSVRIGWVSARQPAPRSAAPTPAPPTAMPIAASGIQQVSAVVKMPAAPPEAASRSAAPAGRGNPLRGGDGSSTPSRNPLRSSGDAR